MPPEDRSRGGLKTEAGEATLREQLQRCSHQPRKAAADRARGSRHRRSLQLSKATSPAYTLISAWKMHFRFLTS